MPRCQLRHGEEQLELPAVLDLGQRSCNLVARRLEVELNAKAVDIAFALLDVVKRVTEPVTNQHDVAVGAMDHTEALPPRRPLGATQQSAAAGCAATAGRSRLVQRKRLQTAQATPEPLTCSNALLHKLINCAAGGSGRSAKGQ